MSEEPDDVISRRNLLRRGTCAALGMGALTSQLFTTRMVQAALAGRRFGDYKAMVCVFLFGGNDNGNTLIPWDGGAQNYSFYAQSRGALAIPQGQLAGTVIAPTNTGGRRFAFNPALADVKQLFDSGNVAVVSGVGSLVEPTTKAAYVSNSVELPRQLFAHNWQQEQWQISTADAVEKVGWGGRVADALQAAGANAGATVSMGISLAGTNVFLSGRDVTPYTLSPAGPKLLQTSGLGSNAEQTTARLAFADLLALQQNDGYAGRHEMQRAYADVMEKAIVSSEIVRGLLQHPTAITAAVPAGNQLASQLAMVARLIEYAQSDLGHERQVFFVSMGGFDNHDGLLDGQHTGLLQGLNGALKYFWDALGQIGMRNNVTTFTASDFGRTYVSNGNGSDHGWGSDHLVMGGDQVAGGAVYGRYPNLAIDGPDDTGSGRYIPAHSVDAYAFELAKWMGVPVSEMGLVFPNLGRFLDPMNAGTHLGFMA